MRKRLRPAWSEDELRELYPEPHNHLLWDAHIHRIDESIKLLRDFYRGGMVADLSCGDGAIARGLCPEPLLGDFALGWGYAYRGRIEDTIKLIPRVELFILSETLEHLDDPGAVLKDIRGKCETLFVSTPLSEDNDGNPEHYWSWDFLGVRELLEGAGFRPVHRQSLQLSPEQMQFQLWVCR